MADNIKNALYLIGDEVEELRKGVMNDNFGIGSIDFEKILPAPENGNTYDWRLDNWGVDRNAYYDDYDVVKIEGNNTIVFLTAWASPHNVIEALSKKYPATNIIHRWANEDLNGDCGEREYQNGKVISEYVFATEKEKKAFSRAIWGITNISEEESEEEELDVEINVDVKGKNGIYDVYISTINSSGEHYEGISAEKVGEYVADLIDCFEEEANGESYLKSAKHELIKTDGYSIERTVFDSYEEAKAAMQKEYDALNKNEEGDEWDEDSYIDDEGARLYEGGNNVYIWSIYKL